MEADALQRDRSLDGRKLYSILPVFDLHRRVQQRKDADAGGHCPLELRVLHSQVSDRVEEPLDIEDERYDDAYLKHAVDGHASAEDHD